MALPYFLTRSTILQHVMVHGATGSGKTSMVLIPLMEQLIGLSQRHRDSSIVILDQKGDMAFFESMRRTANACGIPFRWFTTKLRHSTFAMNPFLQPHFQRDLTRNQAAEMFAKAFGLDFGNQYGASYFRDMAVLVLRALLELPEIDSFAKLSNYAKNHPGFFELPKRTAEQTTHLRASLDALATIDPLNVTPSTHPPEVVKNQIDITSLLIKPQVVYFYLPSTLEDLICFTVAKLVGYLLLTAAAMKPVQERKKVFLCIDEFQRIVSQDFTVFVQQARAFNVGCILASQTTADLYSAGSDFAEVLEENTGTKIDLTGIGERQARRMQMQSSYARTITDDGGELGDSLNRDDLTRVTATTGLGTVKVAMPHGLTQCGGHQVLVQTEYPFAEQEYLHRLHAAWPDVNEHRGALVVTGKPPEANSSKKKPAAKKPAKGRKKSAPDSPPSDFQQIAHEIFWDGPNNESEGEKS